MTEIELLRRIWPKLCRLGARYGGDVDPEDLAQEAAWAVLMEFRRSGIADIGWLYRCARNHIQNVLRVAHGRQKGGEGDAWSAKQGAEKGHKRASRINMGPVEPASCAWLDIREHYDPNPELAYHRDEIWQVINDITDGRSRKKEDHGRLTKIQSEYVYLRFWGDLSGPELDAHFGRAMRVPWQRTKEKLARRLAHLESAA